jgi:hypothetical protein
LSNVTQGNLQVNTLVLGLFLNTGSLVLLAELLLTLVLLLGAGNVELLTLELGVVELLDGLGGGLVLSEVNESESASTSVLRTGKGGGGDGSVLGEEVVKLIVGDLGVNVLDVDVGEVGLHLVELGLTVLLGDVVSNENLLLVQQHAVNVLDSVGGSLGGLVVDESVSARVTELILSDLAGQDVTKCSKGVVESLVINSSVEVLNEDVALTSLAESRVTLGPHDAARLSLDQGVVELLKGTLTISGVVVVDVCVSQRTAGDGITADTDGGDRSDGREQLEEHSLGDVEVELSNVEGGRLVGSRGGGGSGLVGIAVGSGVDGGDTVRRELLGLLLDGGGSFGGRHLD